MCKVAGLVGAETWQIVSLKQGTEEYTLAYSGIPCDGPEVLRAYTERGEGCLEQLEGPFALAVWESAAKRLFLARDRLGIKSLFYALRGDTLLFASALKDLLENPLLEPELDINGVSELLLLGPGRTPGCGVLRGVEELLPGCCGYFEKGEFRQHRYWALKDRAHIESFEQTAEHVRALVLEAVRRQLPSEGPVGTLLSGGLDSSLVSAIAQERLRETGHTLVTFSVDYEGNDQYFTPNKFQPNRDGAYIARMNEFLGADTEHVHVTLGTEELAAALYAAAEARGLPGMADVDGSLLLFCKKIRERVPVALSGECADEIFGGYPWYRDKEIRELDGFPWAQSTAYRASFLRPEFASQIDAAAYVDGRYRETLRETDALPGASPLEKRMKEMMRLNLDWFMRTLLDRGDCMAGHSRLDLRVPFCDCRIVEYLYGVPWEMKDYQGREKGLLREAMRGLLPEEILWRKKSPYPKTHNPAYREAVSAMLREVLADPGAPLLQLVKKEALEGLLTADSTVPWYGQLMTTPQTIAYFLQLNYWMKRFRVHVA
ncbi:MAG: asparagine synthase (glutamine-hydrolyzing) [Firmicutes bacterium]|nr:asparagine synthase (glutamine-hydrolyzing) [Bacillota bacterium]